jgi:hypothetical protein
MYHYQPLRDFLAARGDRSVCLSYDEIEHIIGRPLPRSAKGELGRQWWANTESHSQARAWLSVGRKTKLNLHERLVTFSRPASATSLPEIILVDRSELHPIALRLLETIVAETGTSVESAAAALLNSAAAARNPSWVPDAADEPSPVQ